MKFVVKFTAGTVGIFVTAFWVGLGIGWGLNLWKLAHHLPVFDAETIVRILGVYPWVGGVVGWF